MKIDEFIRSLCRPVTEQPIFDPWWQSDQWNDIDGRSRSIRREQLYHYLCERIATARRILIGEALGSQGGKFTGIPMTSERILLGGQTDKGILPEYVFSSVIPKRTSRPEVRGKGFSEPTGTIVWEEISKSGRNPKEYILWNIFPWHPFNPKKGFLSNRAPTASEVAEDSVIFTNLLKFFQIQRIFAAGKKSADQLNRMGIVAKSLRHPAQGGATLFRKQFAELIS